MPTANDRQVAGSHYKVTVPGYQHWDYVIHALKNRYLEGAITKYALRWRGKNGLEDVRKASHFMQKLQEAVAAGSVKPQSWGSRCEATMADFKPPFKAAQMLARGFDLDTFCATNNLGSIESEVIRRMVIWRDVLDLAAVQILIYNLEELASEEA